jgi:hypothetical protein
MNLQQLGLKYGTDKSRHTTLGWTYLEIYQRYFASIRENVKVFLEIGILSGESCKLWEEYFPNAMIHMIDINPNCKQYETARTKIHIGDQNDEDFLARIKDEVKNIDILIDDGSHISSHQIKSFQYLYPNINSQGFYIIEDLRNSYEESVNSLDLRKEWPGMNLNKPSDPLKNYRKDLNDFFERHIKQLDFQITNNLLSIHFYPMIAIFENHKK